MNQNKVLIERHTPGHVPVSIKIKRVVWNITAAFLFRPFITPVFRKWRIALLRLFGAKIEWDANVRDICNTLFSIYHYRIEIKVLFLNPYLNLN
jgi:hypothetical protein